ncbi:MAG: hypothetical protein H0T76_11390 [Nannocystis sp.]|nr:hypothetical protein [Nannocystis sp.]MBA3547078.1 hypothetical protein [Nannocystis sp.]
MFRLWAGAWAIVGVNVGAGCDLLGSGDTMTAINGAHHAGRNEAGVLPNYGEPDQARVFINDLGWTITLSDGFVVTTAVRIETCDGESSELGMPFGPFPEYWLDRDKNVTDFARGPLDKGEYCTLHVEYGRYLADTATAADDAPFAVKNAERVEGTTLSLIGYAERDDGMGGLITHPFALRSAETFTVALSLDEVGSKGGPFKISGEELNQLNLTVGKTYDQFFAGVDFDAFDPAALEAELPELLTQQTGVILGTSLY